MKKQFARDVTQNSIPAITRSTYATNMVSVSPIPVATRVNFPVNAVVMEREEAGLLAESDGGGVMVEEAKSPKRERLNGAEVDAILAIIDERLAGATEDLRDALGITLAEADEMMNNLYRASRKLTRKKR